MTEETKMILEAIKGLQNDVSDIKKDISGVKEEISGVKEEVNDIKKEISGVKEEVSDVKEEVSGVKKDISSVKEEVRKVIDRQDVFELKLDKLQDSHERMDADIRILSGEMASEFYKTKHQINRLEDKTETVIEILKMNNLMHK